MAKLPPYAAFYNPVLEALRQLGGSGSVGEIYDKAVQIMGFSKDEMEILHNSEGNHETEIEYRLAWARTYLKKYGLIDNSSRGIWSLTPKAASIGVVDPAVIVRFVKEMHKDGKGKSPPHTKDTDEPPSDSEAPEEMLPWRADLHRILTQELTPDAFERLIQRLLRESGFIQVEVTGRAGDGGIDGKGIARIHGIMSFHVVFQCKRYQGVVGAGHVRDFRGATVGRADKGLFITTGTFSRDAIKEATRDGASPIDLIDGDQLVEKLKELRLGVNVDMVERVTIEAEWFRNI